jgi:biotin carboxyl carrier protein
MRYEATVGTETYIVEVNEKGQITLDGETVEVDFAEMGVSGLYSLLVNNESFEALIESRDDTWYVLFRGDLYEVHVADERAQLLRARADVLAPESGEVAIKAPMPGLVVDVTVKAGQAVEAGDKVVILESMKMENELKAPRTGRVERVNVSAGDSVEQHEVMVVIV